MRGVSERRRTVDELLAEARERLALSDDLDRPVILMCNEGHGSSLAAAVARELGYARATDLAGGFQSRSDAGLPVEPARRRSP